MATLYRLAQTSPSGHNFSQPVKRIHDGPDVQFFLSSLAYRDIMTFLLQLNRSMVPRKIDSEGKVQIWTLDGINDDNLSNAVKSVRNLIGILDGMIAEAPPDTGPRRFGNVSFRRWVALVEEKADQLLTDFLPPAFSTALVELKAYLLGSFGSPQRLDYGTGHELSFLAFLAALWKLGFFTTTVDGSEERAVVLAVFEPYLDLVRRLITTYNLEPAGSHGVWGLDDNSFIPYIFGSAQLCPAIQDTDETPTQGSIMNAPDPSIVTKLNEVEKEKHQNMYFAAIAFIYEVKKGPFWEHSPVLFDISGIKDGWGKINKGMIKMYNAEVLSKFPVVQHFPFGSLFKWERNPEAKSIQPSTHTASQPLRNPVSDASAPTSSRAIGPGSDGMPTTVAPWANSTGRPPPPPVGFVNGVTQAPWAKHGPTGPSRGGFVASTRRPVPNSITRAIPETKEPRDVK